ncbi:MAG: hypothetical protein AAFZ38_05665 [Myxococcota bacterium]
MAGLVLFSDDYGDPKADKAFRRPQRSLSMAAVCHRCDVEMRFGQ